jgi:hypothetical protein
MTEVWTMGEFQGSFSSGAPGIFIDTVARLGHSAAIIGGVGAINAQAFGPMEGMITVESVAALLERRWPI